MSLSTENFKSIPKQQGKRLGKRKNPTRAEPGMYASAINTRVADFTRELRQVDTRVIQFNQWFEKGLVTSTSAAAGLYAFSVQFNELPDYANYATVYDVYKLESLEFHFIPVTQPSLPATSIGYSFCLIANDYDDATSPSGTSQLYQVPSLTVLGPGEKHTRKIRPHTAVAATSSSAAAITGAGNAVAGWFDITSSNIPHYGVKVVVSQSTSTNANAWFVFVNAVVSLKSQR
jgi:hypothetical protein